MKVDSLVKIQKQRQQNNQREPRAAKAKRQEPTVEQMEQNDFRSAGMAYQKIAVIDRLYADKRISAHEWIALDYYSGQANNAHRSPIKSNLDKTVSVSRDRPIAPVCPFKTETERMERAMGFRSVTARAICVDNYTLSAWAIHSKGGREKTVNRGKKNEHVVIVPRKDCYVEEILKELKKAASKIRC